MLRAKKSMSERKIGNFGAKLTGPIGCRCIFPARTQRFQYEQDVVSFACLTHFSNRIGFRSEKAVSFGSDLPYFFSYSIQIPVSLPRKRWADCEACFPERQPLGNRLFGWGIRHSGLCPRLVILIGYLVSAAYHTAGTATHSRRRHHRASQTGRPISNPTQLLLIAQTIVPLFLNGFPGRSLHNLAGGRKANG